MSYKKFSGYSKTGKKQKNIFCILKNLHWLVDSNLLFLFNVFLVKNFRNTLNSEEL